MGEGAGVLLLKRLSDAIGDGDDIKAVIRGVGGSSDGRGKGITAPSQRGQVQAVSRAYAQAGYDPSTVELVEAHGTSTKVGDATNCLLFPTLEGLRRRRPHRSWLSQEPNWALESSRRNSRHNESL